MSRGSRAALGVVLCALICAGVLVRSSTLRTSLAAAYRAFRDPSLVAGGSRESGGPSDVGRASAPPACRTDGAPRAEATRPLTSLIARELEPARVDRLEGVDGVAVDTLVMPELRVPITRRALRYVSFYTRSDEGRALFLRRFRRAGAYREIVERALREAGLPEDLLWVVAVESGFDPRAVSSAGAAGLWQFMPRTAAAYGLEVSAWVDARMSLGRSTSAAVAHLRDLYERFDQWDLALAAYNLGYDGVLRAMQRVAASRDPSEHGPLGLAELAQEGAIPDETADYVPHVLAFAIVALNRPRFGLDQPVLGAERPLDIGELAAPAGTRLRTIARAAGISVAALREYNPELLRDLVPPDGGDYLVSIPADRVARTLALLPAYLRHEVVSTEDYAELQPQSPVDDDGVRDAASSLPRRAVAALGEAADDAGPLPRRPASLGQNRLPLFNVPLAAPAPMPLFGNPEALEVRLPVVLVGSGAGFRRAFGDDPLGLNGGLLRVASNHEAGLSSGAEGLPGAGDASIERQLAFLHAPERERVERFRLSSGIGVELRADPAAPLVSISASVMAADPWVGEPQASSAASHAPALVSEARFTLSVPPPELDVGITLVAARLGLLLREAETARVAELRKQANAGARSALSQTPHGRAWLSIGEALFPPGHPLEAMLLGARDDGGDASGALLVTESLGRERGADRATIAIVGDVGRAAVEQALSRALARLPSEPWPLLTPHPREERILIEDDVPSPRLLYGWIATVEGAPDEAALRVAMEILTSPRGARLMVSDGKLAADVSGRLSLAARGGAATIEITLAAEQDAAAVERHLDAELASLAAAGPTWKELALAKALLKHRLERELLRLTDPPSPAQGPRPITVARLRHALDPSGLPRLTRAVDEVDPAAVRSAVARTFAAGHRAVVVTWPRGRAALVAAGSPGSPLAPRR